MTKSEDGKLLGELLTLISEREMSNHFNTDKLQNSPWM